MKVQRAKDHFVLWSSSNKILWPGEKGFILICLSFTGSFLQQIIKNRWADNVSSDQVWSLWNVHLHFTFFVLLILLIYLLIIKYCVLKNVKALGWKYSSGFKKEQTKNGLIITSK